MSVCLYGEIVIPESVQIQDFSGLFVFPGILPICIVGLETDSDPFYFELLLHSNVLDIFCVFITSIIISGVWDLGLGFMSWVVQ